MVKRFKNRIVMDESGPHDELREDPSGDWVQATDYDAAIAVTLEHVSVQCPHCAGWFEFKP